MDYKILEGQQVTLFQGIEHVSDSTYWINICIKFNSVSKLSRSDTCQACYQLKIHTELLEF